MLILSSTVRPSQFDASTIRQFNNLNSTIRQLSNSTIQRFDGNLRFRKLQRGGQICFVLPLRDLLSRTLDSKSQFNSSTIQQFDGNLRFLKLHRSGQVCFVQPLRSFLSRTLDSKSQFDSSTVKQFDYSTILQFNNPNSNIHLLTTHFHPPALTKQFLQRS